MARKDGVPKAFGGMDEGSMEITSPLWNEEAFLVAKEATVGGFQVGIGGGNMWECMPKLVVQCLVVLIIPLIHRAYPKLKGMGGVPSDMGKGLEGCFPSGGWETNVLGKSWFEGGELGFKGKHLAEMRWKSIRVPLSKRTMVLGGPKSGEVKGWGGFPWRKKERRAWYAKRIGITEKLLIKGSNSWLVMT